MIELSMNQSKLVTQTNLQVKWKFFLGK